jgi:hypothetical protein
MTEDMFTTDYCHHCGSEYSADLAAAPRYCALYGSRGCAETGGYFPNCCNGAGYARCEK